MKKRLTPVQAIRKRCLDCSETSTEIKECKFDCDIWPFRMAKRPKGTSPLRAIRKYCHWCQNGQSVYVRECEDENCPLHSYRMGKSGHKRVISQKQKEQLAIMRSLVKKGELVQGSTG